MMYQTVVLRSRWTCNCGAATVPAPDVRMSSDDALNQAALHVEFHNTGGTTHELVLAKGVLK